MLGVGNLAPRYDYLQMTIEEIQALDKRKTVIFMSLSPVETHGFHLPLGTDVQVAENVKSRVIREFLQRHSDYSVLEFPPLFLGADPVPYHGSISIAPKSLCDVLKSFGRDLAAQGFRYMVLTDNHGGPRHQLAIFKACRGLFKRYSFYLIDPFLTIYRKMVHHDPELLAFTGLSPGVCGDDADNHAGANETSLALAIGQKPAKNAPPSFPVPAKGFLRLLTNLGLRIGEGKNRDLGKDLVHLANTLSWVNEKPMIPYMGDPSLADEENGRAMLDYHVKVSMELLERALKGEDILNDQKPMLSFLSFTA